jgi:hypothetical protein
MGIAGFAEELAKLAGNPALEEYVRQGVLPVLGHWDMFALNSDGEPLTSEGGKWHLVTNSLHLHIVLAVAAHRYPLLAHLRPERGPRDPDCQDCGGTGMYPFPKSGTGLLRLVCRCGGLGWYPADAEPGPW